MFRPGLRDPVPTTADGGALQEALQHVWFSGGLHNSVASETVWWREAPRTPGANPLPRLGCRERDPVIPV